VNSAKKASNSCFANTAFPKQKKGGPSEQYIAFFVTKRLQLRFQPQSQTGSKAGGDELFRYT